MIDFGRISVSFKGDVPSIRLDGDLVKGIQSFNMSISVDSDYRYIEIYAKKNNDEDYSLQKDFASHAASLGFNIIWIKNDIYSHDWQIKEWAAPYNYSCTRFAQPYS